MWEPGRRAGTQHGHPLLHGHSCCRDACQMLLETLAVVLVTSCASRLRVFCGWVELCRHLAVTLSGGETAWEDSSVVGGALGAKGCYTIHYETGDDWPVNVRWTMLVRTGDSSVACCGILSKANRRCRRARSGRTWRM